MKYLVIILISINIISCNYSGDGKFESEGIWPFNYYFLKLPEFSLKNDNSVSFSLDGYESHGRSLLKLYITNPTPISFHELDAVIEIKVIDNLNTTYFYRNGALNQHFIRMKKNKNALYPLETEWATSYQYGIDDIDKRVVPFSSDIMPKLSTTASYAHFFPTGNKSLKLIININNIPNNLVGLTGYIELHSSWK